MREIPKSHPRYFSLKLRNKISHAMKNGITHETGLIAHGRGEAFDYLIGEQTIPLADNAEKVAAAALLISKNPILSINGNVTALNPKEHISLSEVIPAKLEVNLFHRTNERVNRIINELKKNGAKKIYGKNLDANIPGLDHNRGLCSSNGIFSADIVLVSLEDGDRCKALKNIGKKIIAIDLNPLSRTARTADITIVDNVIRAIPNIEKWIKIFKKKKDKSFLFDMVEAWNNDKMLHETLSFISKRLNLMFKYG
jgi:4-phosphopantoate--beta-alanine ligase